MFPVNVFFPLSAPQFPYLHFLRALAAAAPGRPILLAEAPHMSLRLVASSCVLLSHSLFLLPVVSFYSLKSAFQRQSADRTSVVALGTGIKRDQNLHFLGCLCRGGPSHPPPHVLLKCRLQQRGKQIGQFRTSPSVSNDDALHPNNKQKMIITKSFKKTTLRPRSRTVDEMAHAVAAALAAQGFRDACFVGHSYGTFVISRLRQLYPQVEKGPFLESDRHQTGFGKPVCFMGRFYGRHHHPPHPPAAPAGDRLLNKKHLANKTETTRVSGTPALSATPTVPPSSPASASCTRR